MENQNQNQNSNENENENESNAFGKEQNGQPAKNTGNESSQSSSSSWATDGPLSQNEAEGGDNLNRLDEQVDSSDADKDEFLDNNDSDRLGDQMDGGDADYDPNTGSASSLNNDSFTEDDTSLTDKDDEEIDFNS